MRKDGKRALSPVVSASLPDAERNRLAGIREQVDTLNQHIAVLEHVNGSRFVTVGETESENDCCWRNVA